jgi:opacity protein-like surface antigen
MKTIIQSSLLILCGGTLTLLPPSGFADGPQDFHFQRATERYMDLPENARTFGMAGSSVLISGDSSSVVGNPAGMGWMEDGEASVSYGRNSISGRELPSYNEIEQEENMGQVLFTHPLGPVGNGLPDYGNIGFGWSGYESDTDDTIDSQTDGYRITAGYAMPISDQWSLGYALSYFNDSLESNLFDYPMTDGFRHTVGVQRNADNDWLFGSTAFIGHGTHDAEIFSLGTNTESDVLEVGLGVGVGTRPWGPATLLAAAVEYRHYDTDGEISVAPDGVTVGGDEEGDVMFARVGIEHNVTDRVALRAGYKYAALFDYDWERDGLDGSAKYNAWSAGAGVDFPMHDAWIKAIRLDYGVEYRAVGNDDWQHLVTVSMPFEGCMP